MKRQQKGSLYKQRKDDGNVLATATASRSDVNIFSRLEYPTVDLAYGLKLQVELMTRESKEFAFLSQRIFRMRLLMASHDIIRRSKSRATSD